MAGTNDTNNTDNTTTTTTMDLKRKAVDDNDTLKITDGGDGSPTKKKRPKHSDGVSAITAAAQAEDMVAQLKLNCKNLGVDEVGFNYLDQFIRLVRNAQANVVDANVEATADGTTATATATTATTASAAASASASAATATTASAAAAAAAKSKNNIDWNVREMDWPFDKAEIPLSLRKELRAQTSMTALEVLELCDTMFADQCKSDPYIRRTLFALTEGNDYSSRNAMFYSTKIHIARALSTRINFAGQMKLSFIERLKESNDNEHEQELLLQDLKTIKDEIEDTKYIASKYLKCMDQLWDYVDVIKVLNLEDLNSVVNDFEQKRMMNSAREDDDEDDDDDTVSTSRSDSSTFID